MQDPWRKSVYSRRHQVFQAVNRSWYLKRNIHSQKMHYTSKVRRMASKAVRVHNTIFLVAQSFLRMIFDAFLSRILLWCNSQFVFAGKALHCRQNLFEVIVQ